MDSTQSADRIGQQGHVIPRLFTVPTLQISQNLFQNHPAKIGFDQKTGLLRYSISVLLGGTAYISLSVDKSSGPDRDERGGSGK